MFFTRRWVLRRFEDVLVELAARGPRDRHRRPERRLADAAEAAARARASGASRTTRRSRSSAATRWRSSVTPATTSGTCRPEQQVGSFTRRRALNWLVDSADGRTRGRPTRPGPTRSSAWPKADRLALDAHLAALEDRIPPDPGVLELVRRVKPDAVLVSPLVTQRYRQTEVVKAARELGIPSGFLVYSWDNLSNKGRIHVPPDRVYVWNDLQRWEAETLHGIDPATIVLHRGAALGRVLRDDAVGHARGALRRTRLRPREADRPLPRLHERRRPPRRPSSSSAGSKRSAPRTRREHPDPPPPGRAADALGGLGAEGASACRSPRSRTSPGATSTTS